MTLKRKLILVSFCPLDLTGYAKYLLVVSVDLVNCFTWREGEVHDDSAVDFILRHCHDMRGLKQTLGTGALGNGPNMA